MADTHTYTEVVKVELDAKQAQRALTDFERKSKAVLQSIEKLKKPINMIMGVQDKATKVINGIMGKVTKLTSGIHNVVIGAIDKASPIINAIGSGISSLASGVGQVMNTMATATAVASTAVVGLGVSSFQAAAGVSEMDATLGALAKSNNLSKEAVDEATKSVRSMGIEAQTSQEAVAKMIQSELDLTQASKLARVAQDAAVIGQTNSSEALDRLIHGITTQQTDVLRGVGINVDAATAQEVYAKSIGKTASDLTAAQKSQAMMNAVLKEGDKIAGSYAAAMQEPGKVLRSFPRLFDDIKVAIGETMLDAFGPFILAAYDMVKAFSAMVQEGQPLNQMFVSIGDALTKLMTPITNAVKAMTNWIKALDQEQIAGFVEQLKRMAPALIPIVAALAAKGGANLKGLLGPLGMIIPTINPIVAALGAMLVMMPGLRKGILGIGSALVTAFTKDAGAIGLIYDILIETFGPEMASIFQPLLQALMEFLGGVQEAGGWVAWLKGHFEGLMDILDPIISRFGELVGNVFGGMMKVLPGVIKNVTSLGKSLFIAFTKEAGAMGDVNDLMHEIFGPEIAGAIQPILHGLMEFLYTVQEAGGWLDFLKAKFIALRPAIDAILERLTRLVVNVFGTLQEYGPTIVQIIRNLAEAFVILVGPVIDAITTFNGWDDVDRKIGKLVGKLEKLSKIIVKVAEAAAAHPEAVVAILKLFTVLDLLWRVAPGLLKTLGIIQKVIGGLGKLGPVITKLGAALGKLGPILKTVGVAIKGVGVAFLAWPGPIKLVITAILALVAALIWLWRNNEDFKNWVINAWNMISEGIGTAIAAIKGWIDTFSATLGRVWEYLKTTWEAAGGELGPFLLQLGTDLLTNLWQGIQTGIPMLIDAVQQIRDTIEAKFTELILAALQWGVDMLANLISGILSKLGEVGDAVLQIADTVRNNIRAVIDEALQWGANIVQNIVQGLLGGLGAIGDAASQIGSTISSSISGAVSGAVGAVKTGGAVAEFVPGGRPGTSTEVVPAGVADTGAVLPTGYAAINKSGRDEIVLPPGKSPITVSVGGITINAAGTANPAALAEEVARALAPRIQAALANMA